MSRNAGSAPKLHNPLLVAGWPGMGLVAFRAVSYIVEKLGPTPIADMGSGGCYPMRGISVDNGIIERCEQPRSRVYAHAGGAVSRDLVIFLGEEQPAQGHEWNVANELLDLALGLGSREIFTFAAMVVQTDHGRRPGVWGCATAPDLTMALDLAGVQIVKQGRISGLNGLLLGVARGRAMNGTCLMGELPYYLTQVAYPAASLAVIEKFSKLTGIEVDLEDLAALSAATTAEIDDYLENMARTHGRFEGAPPGASFSREDPEGDPQDPSTRN